MKNWFKFYSNDTGQQAISSYKDFEHAHEEFSKCTYAGDGFQWVHRNIEDNSLKVLGHDFFTIHSQEEVLGKTNFKKPDEVIETLRALTHPMFARIFFPREMEDRLWKRFEGCGCDRCVHQRHTDGSRMGRMECDVLRMKLEEWFYLPNDMEFLRDWIFYRIIYTESISGCSFAMMYGFDTEGTLRVWFPCDSTYKKISPKVLFRNDCHRSEWDIRRAYCARLCGGFEYFSDLSDLHNENFEHAD